MQKSISCPERLQKVKESREGKLLPADCRFCQGFHQIESHCPIPVRHSEFSIPCRLRSNSKAILISIAGFFIKPYAKCAWPMLSLILSCLLVHRVLHPGKLNSNHKRATDDRASLRLMQYAWFNRVGWFRTPAYICLASLGKSFYKM